MTDTRSPPAAAGVKALRRRSADLSTSTEQRIYDAIFDAVLNHSLPPGTKLPEPSLCELFGVGRGLVRKVLQRLAHDRIVELRPHRGAVVAAPTAEETRTIFEARRAVEAALVQLAVKNCAGKGLEEVRRLLAAERAAIEGIRQPAWARMAADFHLAVAALGDNAILSGYLSELISRCALIVALYQPAGNATCEHQEHTRIVEFIAKGDAASAMAEMEAHLQGLESRIRQDQAPAARSLADMLKLR